jgi:thiamine-monophosphate kinase
MPKSTHVSELDLIAEIRRAFPASRRRTVPLGIGDDCAILRPPPGHDLLVTTDFTLESRHFRRETHPAQAVGHRCLARGLSDLAAMGATPLAAFLSLALPRNFPGTPIGRRWLKDFLAGLGNLASATHTPLAGGDTAQSPTETILADIVLTGIAPTGTALRRSGARPGDDIYVTGALGGAAAELRSVLAGKSPRRASKGDYPHLYPHLYPQPRLAQGQVLRRRALATACIDLSDGLSTDLTHLCAASGVRAEIDFTALPIHPLAQTQPDAFHLAVNGGEDYELLLTAAPTTRIPGKIAEIPLTRIGTILKRNFRHPPITLLHTDGSREPLNPGGWQHFTTQELFVEGK